MPMFTSELSLVLTAPPTEGGLAEFTWVAGYTPRRFSGFSGLPACQHSPIQLLTEPDVD